MALGTFPDGEYVTVPEVRAEGLADNPPSDNQIGSRIKKWEAIVEQWTGQVFRIISPGELVFDGNNAHLLHFNLPIVALSALKINDSDTALAADDYRVYVGRQKPQDDRKNPKIILRPMSGSIFTGGGQIFVKGAEQKITATWGFVEPDDSTPQPIKDAIIQLVIRDFAGYFDQIFGGMTAGPGMPTQREKTDDHEIEYADMAMNVQADRLGSLIPRDIRAMLAMYRHPLAIGAPEPRRFVPYELAFAIDSY